MRGHLIIISPGFRQSRKIRLGRATKAIIAMPLLAIAVAIAAMTYTYPREIQDSEYDRILAENRALALEKETAASEAGRLTLTIARMERISNRIAQEIGSD